MSNSEKTIDSGVIRDFPNSNEVVALLKRVNNLVLTMAPGSVVPRVSPVFFAISDEGKFYWLSHKKSQHSKNIHENSCASVGIVETVNNKFGSSIILGDSVTGFAYAVNDDLEQKEAYELLKEKALNLPETLEELKNPDSLRRIYRFECPPGSIMTGDRAYRLKHSKYMVLGTSPKGQNYHQMPHVEMSEFSVVARDKISVKINKDYLLQQNPNVHVCIFDSDVKQGTGIGLYFNARASKIEGTWGDYILEIEKDAQGNLVLSTNGAIEHEGKSGWIDAQAPMDSTVFKQAYPI